MENSNSNTKSQGRVVYVEPNNIWRDNTLIRSEERFKNNPEDLNIMVDLVVEYSDLYECSTKNTATNESFMIEGVKSRKRLHFLGGTNGSLTSNYTNISLHDTINGDQTEMIGIKSISINYDSWFTPTVVMQFVDVRGASLLIPQEAAMYSQLKKERQYAEENKNMTGKNVDTAPNIGSNGTGEYKGSFFKSLFSFPPPVFYLTVKGFYGKPVTYKLAMQNVSLELDSNNGNFNVNCKFIGYLYGLFTDIPAVYCSISPYIKYNRNNGGEAAITNNWDSMNYEFKSRDGSGIGQKVPMFADFTSKIRSLKEGGFGSLYEESEVAEVSDLEKKVEYLKALQSFFPFYTNKNDDTTWKKTSISGGKIAYFYYCSDDKVEKTIERTEKLSSGFLNAFNNGDEKYNKEQFNTLESEFINNYKDSEGKKFKINDSYISVKSNGNKNVIKAPSYNNGTLYCYDVIKEYENTYKNGSVHVFEYVAPYDIEEEISKAIKGLENEITKKYEDLYNHRNGKLQDVLGFTPCIEDMYYLIFCHMNTFMSCFFDCLNDISSQLDNKERSLNALGVNSWNAEINTDKLNDENAQLPPFPLIFKTKIEDGVSKRVEMWPPDFDKRLENLPEVQLVYAIINAAMEFNVNTAPPLEESNDYSDYGLAYEPSYDNYMTRLMSLVESMRVMVNQSDLLADKNPYIEILKGSKDDDKKMSEAILKAFAMRYVYTYFSNGGFKKLNISEEEAKKYVGYADAMNLYIAVKNLGIEDKFKKYFLNNPDIKKAFKNNGGTAYGHLMKLIKASDKNADKFVSNYVKDFYNKSMYTYNFLKDNDGYIALPLFDFSNSSINKIKETGESKSKYIRPYASSDKATSTPFNIDIFSQGNVANIRDLMKNVPNPETNDNIDYYKILHGDLISDKDCFNVKGVIPNYEKNDFSIKTIVSNKDSEFYSTKKFDLDINFAKAYFRFQSSNIFFTNIYYLTNGLLAKAYLFLMSLPYADDSICNDLTQKSNRITNGYRPFIEILLEGAYIWREDEINLNKKDPIILPRGCDWKKIPKANELYRSNAENGLILDPKLSSYYVVNDKSIKHERRAAVKTVFEEWAKGGFKEINKAFKLTRKINGQESILSGDSFKKDNTNKLNTKNKLYDVSKVELKEYGYFKYFDGIEWGENCDEAKNLILNLYTTLYFRLDLDASLYIGNGDFISAFNNSNAGVTVKDLNTAFGGFFKQLENYFPESERNTTVSENSTESKNAEPESQINNKTEIIKSEEDQTKSNDMRLTTYLTLKNLYDKWIAGTKREDWIINQENKNVFSRFLYIDTFYREIGDKLMVNLSQLNDSINMICASSDGEHIESKSVYTLLSSIAEKNNCMLFALPQMFGLSSYQDEGFNKMFDATPYYEAVNDINEESSFVLMYNYSTSKHLDDQDSPYLNDGFDLGDTLGNISDMLPSQLMEEEISDTGDTTKRIKYVPAFGVTYGKQNQSYFKDLRLSTSNPSVSEYTISSTLNIASTAGGSVRASNTYGQDLYRVFSNYSYQAEVSMMGDANVTSLMYFQLNNVPLWKGAYIITKVSHNITPGQMETKFSGYRLSKYCTNFVEPGIIEVKDFVRRTMEGSGAYGYEPGKYGVDVSQAQYAVTFAPSKFCLGEIKRFERGNKPPILVANEKDTNGMWTIGYGHSQADVPYGLTITPESAASIFNADVAKMTTKVEEALSVFKGDMVSLSKASTYPQGCIDAMIDMTYNAGIGGFKKTKFYNRLLQLKPKDLESDGRIKKDVYIELVKLIPKSLITSASTHEVLPGLERRRNSELAWCLAIYDAK